MSCLCRSVSCRASRWSRASVDRDALSTSRPEGRRTLDGLEQLLRHVEELAPAVDIPLSVDAERCFADDPAGVAETVSLIGAAGTGVIVVTVSTTSFEGALSPVASKA